MKCNYQTLEGYIVYVVMCDVVWLSLCITLPVLLGWSLLLLSVCFEFVCGEGSTKLGVGSIADKSVSFEKSVSFSDEPPDMNSPKQHSPQHGGKCCSCAAAFIALAKCWLSRYAFVYMSTSNFQSSTYTLNGFV